MNNRKDIVLPSALYPFTLDDLSVFQYGAYTLQNVFRSISKSQQQACVEMWLSNNVIPSEQAAWRRSEQVCYFISETATGKLVGVNTLYADSLLPNDEKFFFNRMYLDPDYRSSRLMIIGTALMLCYAKTQLSDESIRGVINVNENTKLSGPGMKRIFNRLGYRHYGIQHNKEILFFEFDRIDYI